MPVVTFTFEKFVLPLQPKTNNHPDNKGYHL